MKKDTAIVSIFVFSIFSFQQFLHVSSSSLLYANQVYKESSGESNLKQEQEHAPEVRCSRERSRAASKVIDEYLTPFVEKENYQLSRKCRLHPENDMFRDQEEHKIYIDRYEWRCGYCKKSFREEKFIDQHFDNRHYNLLNLSDDKCLADLCGALHCDAVMNSKSSRNKCNPAAAARNRHLCEDQGGFFRLAVGALILVLLPVFYLFLYLVQSDMNGRTQELRRISKAGWKSKPS
ncbi:uncharacterized protein [Cicer arietinum]|uniref:Uncharacterized protein LOC101493304 isoform X2 n=1 Tax=Cicer arietinum TaxID=3827 RepID=A0A3Q7XSF6_CICAR|nr:uncharacterized protein LOC101493304 isoform X2 [Cicer arietinum]